MTELIIIIVWKGQGRGKSLAALNFFKILETITSPKIRHKTFLRGRKGSKNTILKLQKCIFIIFIFIFNNQIYFYLFIIKCYRNTKNEFCTSSLFYIKWIRIFLQILYTEGWILIITYLSIYLYTYKTLITLIDWLSAWGRAYESWIRNGYSNL